VEGAGTEVHRVASQTRAALEWAVAAQAEAAARRVVQEGSRQSDRVRQADQVESPSGKRVEPEQAARTAARVVLPGVAQVAVGHLDAEMPLQVVPAWTLEFSPAVRAVAA